MKSLKPNICITLTSPFVLSSFLLGHVARLSRDAMITVCVNRKESDISIELGKGAVLKPVEIRRKTSPIFDTIALFRLWQFFSAQNFDAVLTVTPKGGLLGMLAAKFARVPVRIHCFTGQVWATKTGFARLALKTLDALIASCATHSLADSPSQRDFLIAQGVVSEKSMDVLGDGSISGVNTNRFRPDLGQRQAIRNALGISAGCRCLLYVGRMKREKGIHDLLEVFEGLKVYYDDLQLILVGPDEENLLERLPRPGIHVIGYTKNVERYMAAADIICLPSYREGFGSVLLEAASAGLPSVASRIYGITDAVLDGVTGILHEPGDRVDMSRAITNLLNDSDRRDKMAKAGRLRAVKKFSSERVEGLLAEYVNNALAASGPLL